MKPFWTFDTVDKRLVDEFAGVFGLEPRLAALLVRRSGGELAAASDFLNPRISRLYNPFLMKNMTEAVRRIDSAVSGSERIGVFADSDIDGLSSYTVLCRLLEKMKHQGQPYLRFTRDDEDYGLSMSIIDEFAERGVTLLITLDSGIRDIDEIGYAREKGIEVIVCDHHEAGDLLPDAVIVNPKQKGCPYPFKDLAGVGVTLKLCQALLYYTLKRYDRPILVVARENDRLCAAVLKNRGVEGCHEFDSPGDLKNFFGDRLREHSIFLYNLGIKELDVPGAEVCELPGLLSALREKSEDRVMTAGGTHTRLFNITPDVYDRVIDYAVELFLEYEYAASPRLREFIDSIIDLVALGTIADIMPLRDENRIIVHCGLRAMKSTGHPGLKMLLQKLRSETSSRAVAWNVAPLLNTPGRFGKTELTALFFLSRNEEKIRGVLEQINALNNERKKTLGRLYELYHNKLHRNGAGGKSNLIFITDELIPEGICGLLANRLTDAFNKPVIAVSLAPGRKIVKGSGRSTGDLNFFSFVAPCAEMFEKLGGHAQAFGFSADVDRLAEIREKIESNLDVRAHDRTGQKIIMDLELPLEDITLDFVEKLSFLEPYGCRNEEPVFLSRDVKPGSFQRFGTDRNHGRYIFDNGNNLEAVGWRMADVMEEKFRKSGTDLVYRVEINRFNGHETPRLVIIDLD